MSGQRQPSAAGGSRWLAGAVALGAGLALVALWMLAGSRDGAAAPGTLSQIVGPVLLVVILALIYRNNAKGRAAEGGGQLQRSAGDR